MQINEKIKKSRMTKQRSIILEELMKLYTHPTADELYKIVRTKLPKISLGTVYRNLDYLFENGHVLKLETHDNIRRFDGNTRPHSHVCCKKCGRIADVYIQKPNIDLNNVYVEGFTLLSSRIEIDGICNHCKQEISA